MMQKTSLIIGIVTLFIFVGGVLLFTKDSQPNNTEKETLALPTNHEYFWGEGCPHCENVAKFLETWDGKDKVTIDKKEVFTNQANSLVMQRRAEYCKLTPPLGVPLLVTPEGVCLVGDEPIIDYFKGLNSEES